MLIPRPLKLLPALFLLFASSLQSEIRFNRDIRPILSENCFQCHGSDSNHLKGGLRLDRAEDAYRGLAVIPGKPEESELIRRILHADPDEVMPPPESNRSLTPEQKNRLATWIREGGAYESHWAFTRPLKSELPVVKTEGWIRNPIDAFVLSRLEQEGLKPSPEASIERLLRRVAIDLTGMPASPAQLNAWTRMQNPFAAAVEDCLAGSRFGERMAADWMDLARYADTHGFNNDSQRSMWRWRDWVIQAFNANMPYDRFITEQLAGDLLRNPTLDQRIATGFNRNHVINSEGGIIDEEYRVEYVADRVRTTSMAWMGLTMECARCHDHKFDPISQKDYYRFFAFFNQVDEHGEDGRIGNASPLVRAPTESQQERSRRLKSQMEAWSKRMNGLMGMADLRQMDLEGVAKQRIVQPFATEGSVLVNASTIQSLDAFPSAPERSLESDAFAFAGDRTAEFTIDQGKETATGWAFAAWLKPASIGSGTLMSTMDYGVPESSGVYGRGLRIGWTGEGNVDVRLVNRWPAYSIQVFSETRLRVNDWNHLLVTYDGGGDANGVRIFLDGEESFTRIGHNDLNSNVDWTGEAVIGGGKGPEDHPFVGALSDLILLKKPFDTAFLANQSRARVIHTAIRTPAESRSPEWNRTLQLEWMEGQSPDFKALRDQWRDARSDLLDLVRRSPTTMVMVEMDEKRPNHVLFRGQYDQPREEVSPATPEHIQPEFHSGFPPNRLGLASWLTSRENPLTARVVVNRFWQSIFGIGIVQTAEDFGFQSEYPTHPELLDWLAVEFMESGWDVKRLLKWMVMSATYRQDSASDPRLLELDPENRLLARGSRFRLSAEMLRDQALSVSGLLVDKIGGPSVYPFQPPGLYDGIVVAADYPGTKYPTSEGEGLYRRSLYTFWKRTVPHPTLSAFDMPDREVCVARRLRTNTPLQALVLMNDPNYLEAAKALATRMILAGGGRVADGIRYGFQLATGRDCSPQELDELNALHRRFTERYSKNPNDAVEYASIGGFHASDIPPTELAPFMQVACLMLNLDEVLTRN